jgi:hypothetical protein
MTNTEPASPARGASEAPQPASSDTCSATISKFESAMNHRRRRAALRNPFFSNEEFNALNSVDAYLGVTRVDFEKVVDALSKGLQVKLL